METQYRAVYKTRNATKGAQQHDGGLESNLERLEQLAAGIVENWPQVVTATIYSFPSIEHVVTYRKGFAEVR